MKKFISLFLSIMLVTSLCAVLYSCDNDTPSSSEDNDDDSSDKKSSKTDPDVKKWADSLKEQAATAFEEDETDSMDVSVKCEGNEVVVTLTIDLSAETGEITNKDIAEMREMFSEIENTKTLNDLPVDDFGIIPEALEGLTLRYCTTDGDTIASCTIGWADGDDKVAAATRGDYYDDEEDYEYPTAPPATRDYYYDDDDDYEYPTAAVATRDYYYDDDDDDYYVTTAAVIWDETEPEDYDYYPATEAETIDVESAWSELCEGMTPEEIASCEADFTEMGLSKEDVIGLMYH